MAQQQFVANEKTNLRTKLNENATDAEDRLAALEGTAGDIDIVGLPAETTADNADLIAIYDNSATTNKKMTRANFLAGLLANPMTTLGDVIFGAASGVATRLAGNTTTTRKFFRQVGDGTNSAAPVWDTLTPSDIAFSSIDITANHTATLTNDEISANATSGTVTITLPAAATRTRPYFIRRTNSAGSNVVIDANGTETINGNLTLELTTQYAAVILWPKTGGWAIY